MASDPGLGLLLDRRVPTPDRPFPAALTAIAQVRLDDDARLHGWLVRANGGGPLPQRIQSVGFGTQKRLLDRFFLPELADREVVRTLFDMVASIYDTIIDPGLNLATAARLLDLVVQGAAADPLVLDFGCGTGIAAEAAEARKGRCRLIGTDLSGPMLRIARGRGMNVLPIDLWRETPPRVDGAIACFVLHYGANAADLATLVSSLRPGAMLAANLFRMSDAETATLEAELARLGMAAGVREPCSSSGASNMLVTFRRTP